MFVVLLNDPRSPASPVWDFHVQNSKPSTSDVINAGTPILPMFNVADDECCCGRDVTPLFRQFFAKAVVA